ncbi:unnamed protein product, partial [marine sediment metagenome]
TDFSGYVHFRMTPVDIDTGRADTITILIDQLGIAIVTDLSAPSGELAGDVLVTYALQDDEQDTISLKIEYSVDGGATWDTAATSGNTTDLDTSLYNSSFTWHTATDLPGVDTTAAILKVTPHDGNNDGWPGIADSIQIDNNEPPTVTILLTEESEVSGNVAIPFQIADNESDIISIGIKYSTDSMDTWLLATTIDTTLVFDYTSYVGTITWISHIDLPLVDLDSVWIRLAVSDADPGGRDTVSIHLDNESGGPHVVSISPLDQDK